MWTFLACVQVRAVSGVVSNINKYHVLSCYEHISDWEYLSNICIGSAVMIVKLFETQSQLITTQMEAPTLLLHVSFDGWCEGEI